MNISLECVREEFEKWRKARKSKNAKTPERLKDILIVLLKDYSEAEIRDVVNVRPYLFNKIAGRDKKSVRNKSNPRKQRISFVKASTISSGPVGPRSIAVVKLRNQISIEIFSGVHKTDLKSIFLATGGVDDDRNI
jgi:hypothetical protein